ncbi:MAG: hydroxymethylpyrimidine/phosphomethylpyrimidine kinase, partial [Bryobacteraceae bacterium]|nr:hydroxymethylpyrimidine/phosphomethylpyrimidine kinase [Bryobacteraceae bacterium]
MGAECALRRAAQFRQRRVSRNGPAAASAARAGDHDARVRPQPERDRVGVPPLHGCALRTEGGRAVCSDICSCGLPCICGRYFGTAARERGDCEPAASAAGSDQPEFRRRGGGSTAGVDGRSERVSGAERVRRHHLRPLVVDPVLVASSGEALHRSGLVEALRGALLPLTTVVTPNPAEAAVLSGRPVTTWKEIREAARAIR